MYINQRTNQSLVSDVADPVIVTNATLVSYFSSHTLVRNEDCVGLVRSEDCLKDRENQHTQVDTWIFSAVVVFSIVGLCMALKGKNPRLVLGIVSFPGFAAQVFLFGVGIYFILYQRSGLTLGHYLLMLTFPLVISIMFLGMPLISFLVMVGVIIGSARRNQSPIRWTPAMGTLLALTILSYAITAYLNFTGTLPN